jgi:TonB family protein
VQEAVSAVLHERAKAAESINRMLMLSVGAHVVLLASVLLLPGVWSGARPDNRPVMTISIGGVEGPNTGGMTAIADRAVQEIAKPNTRATDAPPAAKTPEMVEPTIAKPLPKPAPRVEKPAAASRTKPPTSGDQIKTGSAQVKTGGAATPFGGLAQGGGGGGGVRLDVQNFCCPEYIILMRQRIQQRWNPNMGAAGQPEVKFTIRRDGMITNVELSKSSGQALLDLEARRAVHTTIQLPPLPREFTGEHLTVYLVFDFRR